MKKVLVIWSAPVFGTLSVVNISQVRATTQVSILPTFTYSPSLASKDTETGISTPNPNMLISISNQQRITVK
jgi:hypothetical protein